MKETLSTPGLEPYLVLAQELMRRVYAEDSPEEIRNWLAIQLQRLGGGQDSKARLLWEQSFEVYEQIMQKRMTEARLPETQRRLLSWPWRSWAEKLDPLEPGILAVIAAADGAGKTMCAENLAEHWAKLGYQVVFLHFELSHPIMLDRRMVRASAIPRRTLRLGQLSIADRDKMQEANERMKAWPGGITYVHTPGWTMEHALAETQALISDGLCDVFIVDYLEKASASPRQLKLFSTNIFAREANDVEQIKSFAEQNEVPAVLLAQLNKLGKGQSFENLDRTAIRGAGEKTEKANIVVMLYRDTEEFDRIRVRIDKNTLGPTGSFEQVVELDRFRMADISDGIRAQKEEHNHALRN